MRHLLMRAICALLLLTKATNLQARRQSGIQDLRFPPFLLRRAQQ